MKRLVAVLAAAGTVASLAAILGPGGAQATPRAPALTLTSAFAWRTCGGGIECGEIKVPLDATNPAGTKISLAVTRKVHTAAPYLGVMLTNPGGPGASGYGLSTLGDYVPGGVGAHYDWIGFDPRGVGQSTPALHCNRHYFGADRPNFVPRTQRLMHYWVAKTNQYAGRCATSSSRALLPFLSTRDSVTDMELIRATYAAENPGTGSTLNYYGFSYGTYLGQAYAVRYPSRVGRFVLDGVVDPTSYWYRSNLQQEVWFDRNLNTYFQWLAAHPGAYHLGRDWKAIRKGYRTELVKLDRHPAARGRLGPDELTDAMLSAGYYVYDWDTIGRAYSQLIRFGRGGQLFSMYASANMGDDNGYAMYLATQCTDARRPAWSVQVRDARRMHRRHPFIAWDNTWFNAPCRHWPAPSHARLALNGAHISAKILLINETYDAATPFSGALRVRALFPSARLIEGYHGTTHAGSLSGVKCVDQRVANYLATGAVPARLSGNRSDVRCHRVPPPAPGGSGLRTTSSSGIPSSLRSELMAGQRFYR